MVDLTTIERVNRRGSFSGSADEQTLLAELISEVSADAEEMLCRHIWSTSRTEVYRLDLQQKMLSVKGAPIASLTSVRYARQRDMTSAVTMESHQYNVDTDLGLIEFRYSMPYSPGYIEVAYTGGMVSAATENDVPAAFIAAYPHLAGALDQEIIERFRRKNNPSGSVTTKRGSTQQYRDVMLLRDVKRRLLAHKRRRWL